MLLDTANGVRESFFYYQVLVFLRPKGAGSSLNSLTALCPSARHINPSLVLVQPRKTRPYITERLLMEHKESNQTKTFDLLFSCLFREYHHFQPRVWK